MNKCDWCENSRRDKHGNLYCPYNTCWLSQEEILKILERLRGLK